MSRHRCEPSGANVYGVYCKTCDEELDPVFCKPCDGTGHDKAMLHTIKPCPRCNGTGVRRWRKVK